MPTYMIYRLILKLRNAYFRDGRRSTKADVPVVCVGNITVGGTGKTPHTEMVLRELKASERWGESRIAVLSRGYRRRSKGFQILPTEASAAIYGDEPSQIKRKFPDVTVAVDKNRVEGCALLAKSDNGPAAGIIVLDDAYQYRRLQADLNIVLSPYSRPAATDSLLPGGRLRDLPERLYDADIVIVTKCPTVLDEEEKADAARTLGYESFDPASGIAVHEGRSQMLLFSGVSYEAPQPVFHNADTRYTYSHKAVLFSGIANDAPMRNYLSDSYEIVGAIRFSDHHKYTRANIKRLMAMMKKNPTATFYTTEKDAQRLRDLNFIPEKLRERLFCLPIRVEFLSEKEKELFTEKLITL